MSLADLPLDFYDRVYPFDNDGTAWCPECDQAWGPEDRHHPDFEPSDVDLAGTYMAPTC